MVAVQMPGGTRCCLVEALLSGKALADRPTALACPAFRDTAGEQLERCHPPAESALIALGVLEVIDGHGRVIPIGGAGEQAVRDARRLLAEDAPHAMGRRLTTWLDDPTDLHPRTFVEALVLAAVAARRQGDDTTARQWLRQALDVAAGTGIVAPLLIHREHLRDLLVATGLGDLGTRGSIVIEMLDRINHVGVPGLVEPLTDREVEVLGHLPTLMSNTEIAAGMHLSVNTVKTHLKAVYRKLGVEGRRAAVLRGRELQLI